MKQNVLIIDNNFLLTVLCVNISLYIAVTSHIPNNFTKLLVFSVTLENVFATGRVGLFIREDSFVAEHYDLEYKPEDITVTVRFIFLNNLTTFLLIKLF